ncbi:7-carboxy-7-deazaguanine synthase QueE [Crocosphaera sp. XPORK-15E]|uniref:7-carboxy-7-deazaguanine synthase QueE n=1 Tax=Crocosphaera sp. XPORK-15E TaxID=3110247 RepID=UPI002B21E209|nr:7-carboxy-7-deazaguanine synthase QueE [Crocosphaera sp. XPORK-15E]MEA5534307.1 7-carboxy-7-deazaguanine synthase QueE [Crocosphaera sp. XPORK-15E]
MKAIAPTTLTYPIVETFHSIQGEGTWMGVSAFFIRLAGCDVYCPWCDQKESWTSKLSPQQSIKVLGEAAKQANPTIVIITGGEPLMHDLWPLTKELQSLGLRVHLETSGAHAFSGQFDWVTFSPKPFKVPHESVYSHVNELKVVIANQKDLIWAEEQAKKLHPEAIKYLQPEWNSPQSQPLIFDYILDHPDWRMSLQMHKFLGVR